MEKIEEKFMQRLEEDAAKWIEEELAKRMVLAKEAIEEQANTAVSQVGPGRAMKHIEKALAYAEENLRMDLEFEANTWIEEEIRKRKAAVKETGK